MKKFSVFGWIEKTSANFYCRNFEAKNRKEALEKAATIAAEWKNPQITFWELHGKVPARIKVLKRVFVHA
jgi:2-polyprenyl-3-methyl-5-hydroxy-6-metoxy-1,4-benzoquinol methylase